MVSAEQPGARKAVYFGPFRLLSEERLLARENVPVPIGGRAFDILVTLIDRAGDFVSSRELIDTV